MKAVLLKSVKKGQLFTLRPVENPKDSQVYVRDSYERSLKKYECYKYFDVCDFTFFNPTRIVYIDFIF